MKGGIWVVLAVVTVATVVPGVATAQDSEGGGGVVDSVVDPIVNELTSVENNIISSIPSPIEIADEVVSSLPNILRNPIQEITSWISGALDMLVGSLTAVIDDIVKLATYVPAPGDPTDPTTWTPVDGSGSPRNTIWGDVYSATQTNIGLAIVLMAFSGALNFRYSSPIKRRQAWKSWGLSFAMIALTWFIAPFGLHLASTLAAGYSPGTEQFFQDPGSFAKLGYGALVGVIVTVIFPTVAVIGLLSIAIQTFLLFLVVFFWPLGWACLSFEQGYMYSLGKFMVNLYSGLLALNIGQAMVLFLLFNIDFTQASVIGSGLSVIMIPGGVLFATVLLPWGMLKQISTGVGVSLGMRDLSYKAERAGRYASKVGPRVQKRLDQIKRTGRAYRRARSAASRFVSQHRSTGTGGSTGPPRGDGPRLPPGERGSGANPVPLPPPDGRTDDQPDSNSGNGSDGSSSDSSERPPPGERERIDRERRRRQRDRRRYIQDERRRYDR